MRALITDISPSLKTACTAATTEADDCSVAARKVPQSEFFVAVADDTSDIALLPDMAAVPPQPAPVAAWPVSGCQAGTRYGHGTLASVLFHFPIAFAFASASASAVPFPFAFACACGPKESKIIMFCLESTPVKLKLLKY